MKRLRNSHLCPGLHAAAVRVFAKNHENRKVNDFSKASCENSEKWQIKRFFVLLPIFSHFFVKF